MRIAEIFHSIQGEGILTGMPSVFIRTSGCNLRCSWCDTPYTSWRPEGRDWSVESLVEKVLTYQCGHCVITGGEPTVAVGMDTLTRALRDQGLHVTIETNGTMPPGDIQVDLASLSPKLSNSSPDASAHPAEAAMHRPDLRLKPDVLDQWIERFPYQLKFVVSGDSDIEEIQALLRRLANPVPPANVMLMPEGVNEKTLRARQAMLIDLCKRHGYRYCSRLHIELFGNTRGT